MSEARGAHMLADVMAGVSEAVARSLSVCGPDERNNAICNLSNSITARGYGGPSYYYGGFEPLTLLAGLAFLAFLLQTLHSLLYRGGHVGDRARADQDPVPRIAHAVMAALDKYQETAASRQHLTEELPDNNAQISRRSWQHGEPDSCSQNLLCRLFHR